MDLAVILGAIIMFVGVLVGFIFTMAALEMKKKDQNAEASRINLRSDFVSVNEAREQLGYSQPISNTEKVGAVLERLTTTTNSKEFTDEDIADMKENLEKVLRLLREHTNEIPQDVADEIEDLVQNVVDRMNP